MRSLQAAPRLFVVSFLMLFTELALIRWLPSQVRTLSFYTNLVLLGAFLGIGLGALLARSRTRLWPAFPWLLALTLGLGRAFSTVLVVQRDEADHYIWTTFVDLGPAATTLGLVPTLALFFVLVAVLFVPLGQEMGRLFREMPPLTAYSLDIAGSLLGSLALTCAAALALPPWSWFLVSALAYLIASNALAPPRLPALAAIPALVAVVALALPSGEEHWTPYYRVRIAPFEGGFDLTVNASLHQSALDLSDEARERKPEVDFIFRQYAVPYRIFREINGRDPQSVLIFGAGTGNDAVVALAEGVQRVVAVEIDPVIARLGRERHPNRPYDDPRVELHVTDARSFLRRTTERFDLVLFGTLDSQTLLAGMSTIRLDNHVYTVESLREARARTTDDGFVGLFFMVFRDWIGERLFRTAQEADGAPPLVARPTEAGAIHVTPIFNWLQLYGPGLEGFQAPVRAQADASMGHPEIARDDWPYLYLRERGIPADYRHALLVLLGISAVAVLPFLLRKREGRPGAPAGFYACMGAGFLLLETKSITELSLLFGSTWQVSGVVISAVLLTILVANRLSERHELGRARWIFPALGVALVANLALPTGAFLALPFWVAGIVASVFVSLPILCAALLFARRFRHESDPDRAFGWNLLGAMVGGVAEYASMAVGIRGLYLVAAACYLGAFLFDRLRNEAASGPEIAA